MDDRMMLYNLMVDTVNECIEDNPFFTHEELLERIADRLISAGVLMPPCKVEDTVYQIDAERVYEYKVTNIVYDTPVISFDKRAIGNGSLFLTREEAEAALAERMNE